jgi:hypothetical protein
MYIDFAATDCLLDTKSEACLFPAHYANTGGVIPTGQKLFAGNGTSIGVLGSVTVEAELGGRRLAIDGYASHQVTEIILGLNFLRAHSAVWHFADGTVEIGGQYHRLRSREGHNACRRVRLETDTELQPRTEAVVPTYVEYDGRIRSYGDWATRPRQLAPHVHTARTLLPDRALGVPIRVLNTGDTSVILRAGTMIAECEQVAARDDLRADVTAREDLRVDVTAREDADRYAAAPVVTEHIEHTDAEEIEEWCEPSEVSHVEPMECEEFIDDPCPAEREPLESEASPSEYVKLVDADEAEMWFTPDETSAQEQPGRADDVLNAPEHVEPAESDEAEEWYTPEDDTGTEEQAEREDNCSDPDEAGRALSDSEGLRLGAVRVITDATDGVGVLADTARLATEQRADADISFIYSRVESGDGKPDWDSVAPLSETAKSLWRQYERLSWADGVLVRRFEEADGRHAWRQVVLPRTFRAEFLRGVHAGVGGGHFGRRRTELAVRARAYWVG